MKKLTITEKCFLIIIYAHLFDIHEGTKIANDFATQVLIRIPREQ